MDQDQDIDYYAVLNVPEKASADEIKKAYRRLSMIHHPDKNQGNLDTSTLKFQEISAAYEILGDVQKRKMYDLERNNPIFHMLHHGTNRNYNNEHDTPYDDNEGQGVGDLLSQLFSNFNSASGPSPGTKSGVQSFFANMNSPMSMSQSFPKENRKERERERERPSPLAVTLTVSYEDMFTGALIPVEIERWLLENGEKKYETEILYVTVPKGVDENEIIVIENKGNVLGDTCRGDVKVFIKLDNAACPEFNRHGIDLVLEKPIGLKDALCGFSFVVKHLNGTNYTITNVGRIISPGYLKKIPNLGIRRDEHTGCLVILFKIQFPETLDDAAVASLKEISF